MEEIIIYKYQLKDIQNALRLAIHINGCHNKKDQTCFDRQMLKAKLFVDNALNGKIDE
jgi:hypothetical protein